jgi:hypothetical protein
MLVISTATLRLNPAASKALSATARLPYPTFTGHVPGTAFTG